MNEMNTRGGPEPRFRVFELIGVTNKTFFANLRLFARAAMLPAALAVFVTLAAQWMAPLDVIDMSGDDPFGGMNPGDFWPHILAGFVSFAILMAYTVACHRMLLLGAAPGGLGIAFGSREIKFIGYTFIVGAMLVLASLIISVPLMTMAGGLGASVGMAANVTIIALVFVRFSLVFPAVAVDAPGGLVAAWKQSRGHTINLFGAYIALYAVFLFLMILPSMLAAGTSMALGGVGLMVIFNTFAQFISAAYFACMLSLAYKALAGNESGMV